MHGDIKIDFELFKGELLRRIEELEKAVTSNLNDKPMAEKNLKLNQDLYTLLYMAKKSTIRSYGGRPSVMH